MSELDYTVALSAVAFVAERFEVSKAIAPALGKGESVMDFEANAHATGTIPDAREVIALHNEEPLSQR
jgi:hypothetical protein